jgi:hypothetical protein
MEKKGLIMEMDHLQVFILLLLSSSCQSDDQLTQAKPLSPGDMLISKDRVFALGFFSPTNSNESLYVGIWYHNIPDRTFVWVANRDSPITTPSSAKLAITNNQELVLSDSATGRPLWTTATGGTGVVAVLLNSGNFVLRSANGTDIWQSFDHPTDTILPMMRVLFSYEGHAVTRLFASKGPADPSTGDFSFSIDPSSNLQFFAWHGTRLYYRINFFNDISAFGGSDNYGTSVIVYLSRVGDELYFEYRVSDDSPAYTRLSFDYTGKVRLLTWNNNTSSWTAGYERPSSGCDLYAACGPFGYCDNTESVPSCRCLDGFEPIDGHDISRGCRRNEALVCGMEDRFVTLSGMKAPQGFMHVENTSFDQCVAECSTNCSCTAYAYVSMSTAGTLAYTSRCLVWTGDLVDTGKVPSFGQDLYVRLAVSHGMQCIAAHSNIHMKSIGNIDAIFFPRIIDVFP